MSDTKIIAHCPYCEAPIEIGLSKGALLFNSEKQCSAQTDTIIPWRCEKAAGHEAKHYNHHVGSW